MERELTHLEEMILEYIGQHPGLTPFDLAEEFEQSEDVYAAIYYLNGSGRTEINHDTYGIIERVI